jgi:hypothetical protein
VFRAAAKAAATACKRKDVSILAATQTGTGWMPRT